MILRDGDSDLFLQGTQPQQLGLSNLGMVRLLRYCFHARGHSAVLQSSVQRKIRVTAPDLPNDDARNCRTEWPRLPLAGIANTTNAASARFATATNDDSGYTTIYLASTKIQSRCWICALAAISGQPRRAQFPADRWSRSRHSSRAKVREPRYRPNIQSRGPASHQP